jgi:hypothetical protein
MTGVSAFAFLGPCQSASPVEHRFQESMQRFSDADVAIRYQGVSRDDSIVADLSHSGSSGQTRLRVDGSDGSLLVAVRPEGATVCDAGTESCATEDTNTFSLEAGKESVRVGLGLPSLLRVDGWTKGNGVFEVPTAALGGLRIKPKPGKAVLGSEATCYSLAPNPFQGEFETCFDANANLVYVSRIDARGDRFEIQASEVTQLPFKVDGSEAPPN